MSEYLLKMNLVTAVEEIGLANILQLLADVCEEKAEDTYARYQDFELACAWRLAANRCSRLQDNLSDLNLSGGTDNE